MIEPVYDIDGITLYQGDAEIVLPQLEAVDLVLTDPPYNLGRKYDGNTNRVSLAKEDFVMCGHVGVINSRP